MKTKSSYYTKGTLTKVIPEFNLYAITMVDYSKPKSPVYLNLDVGRRYSRVEAMDRAEELNRSMPDALKVLGFDKFIPYNACEVT